MAGSYRVPKTPARVCTAWFGSNMLTAVPSFCCTCTCTCGINASLLPPNVGLASAVAVSRHEQRACSDGAAPIGSYRRSKVDERWRGESTSMHFSHALGAALSFCSAIVLPWRDKRWLHALCTELSSLRDASLTVPGRFNSHGDCLLWPLYRITQGVRPQLSKARFFKFWLGLLGQRYGAYKVMTSEPSPAHGMFVNSWNLWKSIAY